MAYPQMTLDEAVKLAEEAEEKMYLNAYPKATVVLNQELKRIKNRSKKIVNKEENNA